jgi:acetyl-CoA carboxylase biotin carboxyl carrier protein
VELRPDEIQEILRVFADSPIEELRLEIGDTRLHLSKRAGGLAPSVGAASAGFAPTAQPAPAAPAPVAAPRVAPDGGQRRKASVAPASDSLYDLRAPLLGTFYRRPAPADPPFVEVGSEVKPGDPVCLIDVMKMFTRVEAGIAGRIAEICVEDGELVEYGQVLMRIEPNTAAADTAPEQAR